MTFASVREFQVAAPCAEAHALRTEVNDDGPPFPSIRRHANEMVLAPACEVARSDSRRAIDQPEARQ